ncbi:MAG: alpha/beta hydrolase [Bdellovibrionales bacterium]
MKLLFILTLFTFSFESHGNICLNFLAQRVELTPENISKRVKYMPLGEELIPYLDMRPELPAKGAILLVSGFSKNMNSWMGQINDFVEKGYRVISFDQSNVGRSLLKNGIEHFGFGEGLEHDAYLGKALLKKLKVKKVTVVGHSRGGWVAARIVDLLKRTKSIEIEKLVLASPYVKYFWDSGMPGFTGNFFDLAFDFTLAFNPGAVGLSMGSSIKHSRKEDIEGVSSDQRDRALGYILKGTNPGRNEQRSTLSFVRSAVRRGLRVQVITDENDRDLAPLRIVEALDIKGVDFSVLKGDEYSHYWPETHPEVFVKKVLD